MMFDLGGAIQVAGLAFCVYGVLSMIWIVSSDYRGNDPHLVKALVICFILIVIGAFIAGGFSPVTP